MAIRYLSSGLAGALLFAAGSAWADSGNPTANQSASQASSNPSAPGWIAPYVGMDMAPGSFFTYGGAVAAVNGDFSKAGFLLMGLGGYGQFKYGNSAVPGANVNGSISMTDAMVGYQTFGKYYRLAGYVGLDYMQFHYSPPDPTGKVNGAEAGFKMLGQFETSSAIPYYLNAMASYSTAFDSYWVQLRPGYRFGPLILGPEAVFQGNKSGNSQRAGAFLTYGGYAGRYWYGVTLSGGYSFVGDNTLNVVGGTRNGPYGALSFSALF